jgi:hypothetical protein
MKRGVLIHVSHLVLLPCTSRCSNLPVPAQALRARAFPVCTAISRLRLAHQSVQSARGSGTRPDNDDSRPPSRSWHSRPSSTPTTAHRTVQSAAHHIAIPTLARPCCCALCLSAAPAFALTSHGLPRTAHDIRPTRCSPPPPARCTPRNHRRPATHECLSVLSSVAATSDPLWRCHVTSRR